MPTARVLGVPLLLVVVACAERGHRMATPPIAELCDEATVARAVAAHAGTDAEVLAWEGRQACATSGVDHAWVAALIGAFPARHVVVLRTTDGGARWSVARLGDDRYTDWPVVPSARVVFHDATRGEVETLDPPQHHNGHRETRATWTTGDGGVHWELQRSASRCLDLANACQGG